MEDYFNIISLVVGIIGLIISAIMAYLYFKDRYPKTGTLSFKNIIKGSKNLLEQFNNNSYRPDLIVGIHTIGIGGGAIVAEILAVELKLPMYVFNIDIKETQNKDEFLLFISNEIKRVSALKKILIVDDICNTGRTLSMVKNLINSNGNEISIAVIVAPPKHIVSQIELNYFVYRSNSGHVYSRDWMLSNRKEY